MKQLHQKNSIQQQISKAEQEAYLIRPNPPTEAAIKRAQFIDKTYVWKTK
jgi:hypothetical protein